MVAISRDMIRQLKVYGIRLTIANELMPNGSQEHYAEALFRASLARLDCGSINSHSACIRDVGRTKRCAIHVNPDMHAEMRHGSLQASVISDLINFGFLLRKINLGFQRLFNKYYYRRKYRI